MKPRTLGILSDTVKIISHGQWLPTNYLEWREIDGSRVLFQKMRRRVKASQGGPSWVYQEYDWQPVPRSSHIY